MRLLSNKYFWWSVGVAFLSLLPHGIWLYRHQWQSITFHLTRTDSSEFIAAIEYPVNIFLLYSPVLILALIYVIRKIGSKNLK